MVPRLLLLKPVLTRRQESSQKVSFFLLSWCFTSTETVGLIRDGGRVGQGMRAQAHLLVHTAPELWSPTPSSFMVLYVHKNRMAYYGLSGSGNESPGLYPCSHSSWSPVPSSFMVLYVHRNRRAYYGLSGSGNESPGLSPCSHSSWALSWCFTSTETVRLIRDGERMGQERKAQAYLPVHKFLSSEN